MPVLSAKVDISGPLVASRDLRQRQIPWTIARALTMTAMQGRDALRVKEGQVFKLRNDWTVQRTLVTPAQTRGEGAKLVAEVYTDTTNRATGAPDYLPRQEDGGEKVPVAGHHYIAIPTQYLRRMAPKSIPDELRPKALLSAIGGRFEAHNRKNQTALRNQKMVNGMVFFLQTTQGGTPAIFGRYWTEKEAYPMWIFVPEAHVKPVFPATEVVQMVCDDNFADNFSRAASETIANDALRGSGLQVNL